MNITILTLCLIGIILVLCLVCYILYKNKCRHNIIYRGYRAEHDEYRNIMYSIRKYQCLKCGKIEQVDTRYGDPYFPKAWKH